MNGINLTLSIGTVAAAILGGTAIFLYSIRTIGTIGRNTLARKALTDAIDRATDKDGDSNDNSANSNNSNPPGQ